VPLLLLLALAALWVRCHGRRSHPQDQFGEIVAELAALSVGTFADPVAAAKAAIVQKATLVSVGALVGQEVGTQARGGLRRHGGETTGISV
jgi:hypothetical protein